MQIDGFIGVTEVEYFEFPKKKINDHAEDHVLSVLAMYEEGGEDF